MDDELWRWDAVDLAQAIRAGTVSAREAVTACLERLAAVNPAINAVTVVLADAALAEADAADRALKRGEAVGPLHGLPVTIKENVDHAGTATTNGVVAFKDLVAKADSPAVANWKRAGAIVIGRTNTPAFSLRWHTDNELHGATRNPWDRARTPGGSSGGAAASLAVGITPLAHGTDYGGSIRYPAYCCGVAGIRPTLGRVPVFNATAPEERTITAQIMAVQGPMARRVRDVRLGLGPMAVSDPRDPWWVPAPPAGAPAPHPVKVALTVDPGGLGVDPAVASAVRAAGEALARAGYAVEAVEPPSVEAIAELWWALAWTETRHVMADTMRRLGGKDVVRALDKVLSTTPELDIVGYMKGLAARAKHVRDWLLFLERYPLVVGPVSTEPPFELGFDTDDGGDPRRLMRAQRLLIAVNLLGLPSAAVPTGLAGGVPIGVQVIGTRYREDLCLDAAEVIEAHGGLPTPIDPSR